MGNMSGNSCDHTVLGKAVPGSYAPKRVSSSYAPADNMYATPVNVKPTHVFVCSSATPSAAACKLISSNDSSKPLQMTRMTKQLDEKDTPRNQYDQNNQYHDTRSFTLPPTYTYLSERSKFRTC